MSTITDVVGFPVEEALNILSEYKFEVSIKETHSPKSICKEGEGRVIKQIKVNDHVKLTVSYF